MQPNVETFIGCDSSYRAASIVLYGAPYDSTTSYRPGARFGPAAIRHESYGGLTTAGAVLVGVLGLIHVSFPPYLISSGF